MLHLQRFSRRQDCTMKNKLEYYKHVNFLGDIRHILLFQAIPQQKLENVLEKGKSNDGSQDGSYDPRRPCRVCGESQEIGRLNLYRLGGNRFLAFLSAGSIYKPQIEPDRTP